MAREATEQDFENVTDVDLLEWRANWERYRKFDTEGAEVLILDTDTQMLRVPRSLLDSLCEARGL